ncbi:hypothetical protein AbraIFM66950_003558 [Aspergillus brasiliensis]|nr:hypothetical protein AbraIFM66950_003558 [Aspergillus brasiliensis]
MIYTTTLLPILLSLTLTATAHPSATHQKRSVTCLKVGATATATWTNSDDQTCTYVGVVGSNYGESSSGDGDDPNCGAAYKAAEDDFLLGVIDGCSQTNPTNAVVKPTASPVCT